MELTQELKKEFHSYNQEELSNAFSDVCEEGHLKVVKYLLTSPDLTEHADIH